MTEEERYAKVENDKKAALNSSNEIYNSLLDSNKALTERQNNYTDQWEKTQNEIADKNSAFQIDQQNQNKLKAQNEFNNEAIASKNAYYDKINPYGAEAEIQASKGLNNSGYSETNQISAWNTQQNRTAKARTTLNDAKLQYDNSIKEIELSRDTTKAQYALEALKQRLDAVVNEYSQESTLKQNQLSYNQQLDSEYNTRYDKVWDQINTEKQFKENIRQFDENIAYLKEKDAKEYELEIQQLEEQKRQAQQEQANWEAEYAASQSNNLSEDISTPYYQGSINSDTQYGTLGTQDSNGTYYQPNNVGGNKLKSVGKVSKYLGTGNTGSTGANIDDQKIWTTNGRYYIWDGSQNKYIDVTTQIK